MTRPKTTTAYVFRTEMIGGGTSYDVHFLKKDKPSYPLHGSTYATVICRDGKEFFSVYDAIDRKARWNLTPGLDKWDTHKRHEKRAERLEIRIAKRAFPELQSLNKLPTLWAGWTLPSTVVKVHVLIQLPE